MKNTFKAMFHRNQSTVFVTSLIFLAISISAPGQQRIDLTYFTLGLVDDYLGRQLVKESNVDLSRIDYYHETETYIMDYLDSLINVENSFRERSNQIDKRRERRSDSNCVNCHEFFGYYARALADDVNSKYKFRFSKGWDEKDRKIYSGKLKTSAIKTDRQRLSFLVGAYLKFGNSDGEIYKYTQANSPGKYEALIRTLKEFNCEIVQASVGENSTPVSQVIEFRPTKELKQHLDKLQTLKARVDVKKSNFSDAQLAK